MKKLIEGFENYEVCDDGSVFSLKRNRYLTPKKVGGGYYQVRLYKDHDLHGSYFYVHRLVAEAFLDKVDGKNEINHIDGNKKNNSISNLEWVNRNENLTHAYFTGLSKRDRTAKKVVGVEIKTGEIVSFDSMYQAARFLGVSNSNISSCCRGIRKQIKGYRWFCEN